MKKANQSIRELVVKNIKYYRKEAQISQEELSLKLGRKKDFIEKLEDKGMYRRFVTVMLLADVSRILGISSSKFLQEIVEDDEQF